GQDRPQAAALGEVDAEVAEVGRQTLAGVVRPRDERAAMVLTLAADVAANLVGASRVAVLVTQAPEELHSRVTLLAGGVLIGLQDGIDEAVEGAEHGGRRGLAACVGLGLGLAKDLSDLAAGVAEGAGDRANTHADA